MKDREKKLTVAETFYSLQGEGEFVGYPAVFLRLSYCNLLCGRPSLKRTPAETKQGDLVMSKDASWICDTIAVWRRGVKLTFKQILNQWVEQEWDQQLKRGAHLVITGGEPTSFQKDLVEFIKFLHSKGISRDIEVHA